MLLFLFVKHNLINLFVKYNSRYNLYKTIDKLFRVDYYKLIKERKREFDMKKTLYSLMLNEEVVAEVDRLAHRLGTNRSNLINQILAEHVNYVTPERRINDIFTAMEQLIQPSRELVPFFVPNAMTMSLKSSLEYKYRPTVKYEVELYRGDSDYLGEMSVVFRTQSRALIQSMTDFFRVWKSIEDAHLRPLMSSALPQYALYEGKFVRSISTPESDCSADELAGAISEYIKLFDSMMKGYLTGRLDARDVEACFFSQLRRAEILI